MNFFKKIFKRDTAHPISDATRAMLDQMFAHGFKENETYVVEFAFFGDKSNYAKLTDFMLSNGYKVDTEQSEEMVIFLKKIPISRESMGGTLAEMESIAKRFGVVFDGWSCAAV